MLTIVTYSILIFRCFKRLQRIRINSKKLSYDLLVTHRILRFRWYRIYLRQTNILKKRYITRSFSWFTLQYYHLELINSASPCNLSLKQSPVLSPCNVTLFFLNFSWSSLIEGYYISPCLYQIDDLTCVVNYLRSSGTVSMGLLQICSWIYRSLDSRYGTRNPLIKLELSRKNLIIIYQSAYTSLKWLISLVWKSVTN